MNQFVAYEYQPGLWHVYQYDRDTPSGIDYMRFIEEGEEMPRTYTDENACLDRARQLNKDKAQ
jgi:hypothetical protein